MKELYLLVCKILDHRWFYRLYFNLKTLPTLGSEPDLSSKSVIWHYCQENRWQPFEQMVLSDTTNGLLNSGIVMLMLPVEAMKQPSIINQNS